ncbi:MAG TPA: SusC/RagA family TonB-linked outer membrane protein [Chitinophagaceae bacterium]|nr:SusC/RagA family TonB-linked outer membrane protein [Chitinophagaceae bacterium]
MRKFASMLFVLMLFCTLAFSQNRTITGTVNGNDGKPISGASVTIKGKKGGTVTNDEGHFSISAANGDRLVFSAVGYSAKEVIVNTTSASPVSITLVQEVSNLTEVIVTGVATATPKAKMTVSVTKLSADKINAVNPVSLSSALTGKVAGIKTSNSGGLPGQQVDIQLRADNNLNNVGSGPLIVVDGVQLSGSLADINADDVESIEVVKGAAASALYGSRAGNGVIAVTTKRGKGSGVNIVVRNEVGIQKLAHTLKVATHHPYKLANDWANFKGVFTKYDGVTYPNGYSGTGFHPGIAGNRTQDADHYMDNSYGIERNPQKDVFGTGTNYTNFISVSSKSEKTGIYASFENNGQQGVVNLTDGYKRQNFRFNLDQQLASWVKFTASNLFVNRTIQYPGTSSSRNSLFYDVARLETDINLSEKNPVDGQKYYPRIDQWIGEITNPMYTLWKRKVNDKSRRWIANYALNFKLNSWANIDVSHTKEIENYRRSTIDPKDTWKVSGGTPATYGMAYTNGGLAMFSSEDNQQNTQFTVNLMHRFGDLNVAGKLSYLYENNHYESFNVGASQYVINDMEGFNNFASISSAGSYISNERAQNYFAIASFDYKDRYLLDAMFRYDGSSLFGSDARWNPYYRLSGAYRLTKDVTMKGIDEFKIRLAHGTAGIRPGFDWQYEVYTLSNGVATPTQKGNKLLKPSKTTETEFGVEVNFLKRFNFEAIYSFSNTTDQFLNAPLIPFLNDGFPSQWQNAGNVKSNTIEITLGANWKNTPNLKWNSSLVFSRVRQKIGTLPIPPYMFTNQNMGDQYIFRVTSNEAYGAMYGYRFVRTLAEMANQLPTGKTIADYEVNSEGYVIDKGTQGTVNERPIKYKENGADWYGKIGDGNAKFNIGITNTITWKDFSFYFLLDWKQGGDIYNGKDQRLAFNNMSIRQDMSGVAANEKKAYDYWFSGAYDGNNANQYWVEDGSYLKIREISIGYNLNNKILKKIFNGAIKGVNAKIVGRNLFTFTKYSGYDPEVGTIRQPYDGIYMNPNFRNYAFSLSFNF